MAKKYFLQKAHKARPDIINAAFEWSIKLDGIRALWDGGVSRGRTDAPWAPGVKATGLWTINAKVIHAPDWWLDTMPNYICDGELWAGPQRFQFVSSVVRRKIPDHRWAEIKFMHHTEITVDDFLATRKVDEKHCQVAIVPEFKDYFWLPNSQPSVGGKFYETLPWYAVPTTDTWDGVNSILDELLAKGHEGIMLKPINSVYTCERSWELLKLKPYSTATVQVIGVFSGAETDRGSMHRGRMGSLVCKYRNNTFKVSGFQHHLRGLVSKRGDIDAAEYAYDHPAEELPSFIESEHFPNGSYIEIKYRELTTYREVPKDPRYFRKVDEKL